MLTNAHQIYTKAKNKTKVTIRKSKTEFKRNIAVTRKYSGHKFVVRKKLKSA